MGFADGSICAFIGIPLIGGLGLAGASFPLLVKALMAHPDTFLTSRWLAMLNGFCCGIILAVGWIHSVPEALNSFTEDITTGDSQGESYPWAALISLCACIFSCFLDEVVRSLVDYLGHSHGGTSYEDIRDYNHHNDDCDEENNNKRGTTTRTTRDALARLLSLFVGLLFHNLFVGIALGVTDDDWALLIAITCHQAFEGLGLGSRTLRMTYWCWRKIFLVDVAFSLAAPIGIILGLLFKEAIDNSKGYEAADATFQALSGGILIYLALVHFAQAYQETIPNTPEDKKGFLKRRENTHRWLSFLGVLLGAAVMSIIGIWA